ncbi:MAG: tripartite tricarboxylate transporter TctB family protein [Chloroflexota bacterium]
MGDRVQGSEQQSTSDDVAAQPQKPPARVAPRPDSIGSWIVAGIIAVAFVYFTVMAPHLSDDLQRWPTFLGVIGLSLSVVYLAQQIVIVKRDKQRTADLAARPAHERDGLTSDEEVEEMTYGSKEDYSKSGDVVTAIAFGGFVLYAFVAWAIGFLVATFAFLTLYMFFNGERALWKYVTVNVSIITSAYLLFGSVLNMRLTRGALYSPDWLTDWLPI